MKYSKKDLQYQEVFLRIEAGELLEIVRKNYDLTGIPEKDQRIYKEIGTISFGEESRWNSKNFPNWYLEHGYKEIFLYELEIEDYYEIY